MDFDIVSISSVVAAVGVVAGMILTVQELRNLRKQRQTDLLVRLAPWLNMSSSELQDAFTKVVNLEFKDYDDFVEKYGPPLAEKSEQKAILTVGNYFEAIGALLRRKLLDTDLVWDCWGETFTMLWERIKPYADGLEKEYNQKSYNAEYLYSEMKRMERQLVKE